MLIIAILVLQIPEQPLESIVVTWTSYSPELRYMWAIESPLPCDPSPKSQINVNGGRPPESTKALKYVGIFAKNESAKHKIDGGDTTFIVILFDVSNSPAEHPKVVNPMQFMESPSDKEVVEKIDD